MSAWGKIAKIAGIAGAGVAAPFTGGASLGVIPTLIGAGGAAISGATEQAAQNRAGQVSADVAQQQLRQQQQDAYERAIEASRKERGDAIKQLATSEYRANAQPYTPPTFHSNVTGKDFTPATPANIGTPGPMSEFERQGTAGLQQELMKRLSGEQNLPPNPYEHPYTIDPKLLKQSVWEKLGNILGPAATAYGTLAGQQQPQVVKPQVYRPDQ